MRHTLRNPYPVVNNRYHIIESLGSGGMAHVYLAHDEILDREVALKILNHHFANDGEFVERFRREARISAALSHSNIASVYDLGETQNGSYYMAMEYVSGGTLRDLIKKEGTLAASKAVEIAIQVAEALEAAHAYGAIHRDVKPQNILLTRKQDVKVVDFGIARAVALSEITQEGRVLGTEHYMSPEQAKGASVGPSSDLYSLGVVLYEMLTGKLPHEVFSPLLGSAPATKRLSGYPRPPKEIDPLIPQKLSAIAVRLLSGDPECRHTDASSLIADLQKAKREPLGDAATRVLNLAFQKGRALREVTKALNSAAGQARIAYVNRTRKTRPYVSSAPMPRHRTLKPSWRKPARGQRQRRNALPRSLLLILTLVAVLAWLNFVDPNAKTRLSENAERKFETALRGIERDVEKALENELDVVESKVLDSINGIVAPSPTNRQKLDSPSSLPNGSGEDFAKGREQPLFPAQNAPFPQRSSDSYSPSPQDPSYPSNDPGGTVS